jgi:BASS family bile acid:Na+ symporter
MSVLIPEWIVSVFAVATIFVVMFDLGLDLAPGEFLWIWRRPALMARALFAVLVAAPILALTVARALHLPHAAEVGMVVMAIAPGAPIALRRSLDAGGDRAFAPGLQVTVALLAVVSMPLSVAVLDELYSATASISPWQLLKQVWLAQFLPLALGVGVGQMHARAAAWLRPRLALIGKLLLVSLALLAIVAFWRVMIATGPRVATAIALVTFAGLAVGHFLGGPHPATRTAVAISTAARNPGLALLAATLNAASPAVKATILTYLLVAGLTIVPYAIWRSRYS